MIGIVTQGDALLSFGPTLIAELAAGLLGFFFAAICVWWIAKYVHQFLAGL